MKILKLSQKVFILITILALLILGASSLYFFTRYQKLQKTLQNPAESAKEETKATLNRVGRLISLPGGEDPTVATIVDVEKLKDQPFFQNAKNGDKVILYTNAAKAILYRESENKIIDVAPINIGTSSAVQTSPTRIALYNGTETVGLTQTVEKNLKAKFPDLEVVAKDTAKKKSYTKTIVIDLNGSKTDITENIAKELKAEITELPPEETKPEGADILIIIGK